jgi:hypothetical protein
MQLEVFPRQTAGYPGLSVAVYLSTQLGYYRQDVPVSMAGGLAVSGLSISFNNVSRDAA